MYTQHTIHDRIKKFPEYLFSCSELSEEFRRDLKTSSNHSS